MPRVRCTPPRITKHHRKPPLVNPALAHKDKKNTRPNSQTLGWRGGRHQKAGSKGLAGGGDVHQGREILWRESERAQVSHGDQAPPIKRGRRSTCQRPR